MDRERWARIIASGGPWYIPKLSFRLDAPPGETRIAMGLFSTEAEAWDYLKWKGREGPAPMNEKNISGTVINLVLWLKVGKCDWYLLDGGTENEERGLIEDLLKVIDEIRKSAE
jgi:hypothetical protein